MLAKISDLTKAYIVIFIFILINSICMVKGFFYFSFIPLILAVLIIAFLRLDTFLLLIVFLTPLSIPLREFNDNLPIDMWLPTEPLLAGLLLLFILKIANNEKPGRKILLHPVSIAIYVNLAWIFVTSLTSSMFLVSAKFFIARLWFIVAFYFVATEIFKKYGNINKYLWCYIIPLLGVITYSISNHISVGLYNQQAAHSVMNPFYTDHTSYGALLAMMIPVVFGFTLNNTQKPLLRIIAGVVTMILIVAIVLSYTRAAWISLFAALGVLVFILLRIKFIPLLIIGLVIILFLISTSDRISQQFTKNKKESSANIVEHVQSVSNITSDMSNLERINRWKCAIRMFKEKPVVGWGPGTYMFQYAPFQLPEEKTLVSTNAADLGNAHSEYLGPLSESGIFGLLTFVTIIILTIYTGLKVYQNAPNKNIKILSLSILLGLVTYYIHGIANNFLDTDKASAPFWGYTAILVVLDNYFTISRKGEIEKK